MTYSKTITRMLRDWNPAMQYGKKKKKNLWKNMLQTWGKCFSDGGKPYHITFSSPLQSSPQSLVYREMCKRNRVIFSYFRYTEGELQENLADSSL